MRKDEGSWLEPILNKELGRVQAPGGLWERVEQPRVVDTSVPSGRLVWALGAAMIVFALLWGFHLRGDDGRLPTQTWMPSQLDSKSCVLCHVGA